MTEREKRNQRKEWRLRSKAYYERKKQTKLLEDRLREESPPPTPTLLEDIQNQPHRNQRDDGRVRQGKLRRRKHIEALNKEIKDLKWQLEKEKNKQNKYRMRLKRTKDKKKNKESPTQKVEMLVEGQNVTPDVKKKLLFSEVIKKQLSENYRNLKQTSEKRKFWKFISGNVIKKYTQNNKKNKHHEQKRLDPNYNRKKMIMLL